MKTIANILISFLVGLVTLEAQSTPPTPPTPPDQTIAEHSKSSSKSKTTVHVNGKTYTYFSITNEDDQYKVKAKFNAPKTERIRTYLLEEFGKKGWKKSGSKQIWKEEYDGETSYEIKLSEGSLRIYVDKELSSSKMVAKMKAVTKNIKTYVSGGTEKEAEREARRLEREAERKVREAERLTREAKRLAREAERMATKAKKN